jgi:uncharacterized protein
MITIDQARRYYANSDAVHDFDHVLRVLKMARRIAQGEGADAQSLRIIEAAALLHDVGRAHAEAQGIDHAAFAAGRAPEILAGYPQPEIEAVAHAVAAHRFRTQPDPETLEACVLFDADKLDAIGAIGVARAFAYGGAHGQRLWAPVESVDVERWHTEGDDLEIHTPVHEFVVKLSRLKDRLYTATGRAIAGERHAYMVAFFDRLNAEVGGEK